MTARASANSRKQARYNAAYRDRVAANAAEGQPEPDDHEPTASELQAARATEARRASPHRRGWSTSDEQAAAAAGRGR